MDPRRVGRYRITARLGAGGMGRVYLGSSASGRLVAVKVVRPELADTPGFRQRFAREVEKAQQVTGFFTAAVVDADPDAATPWLATAYVPGMSLDRAIEAHGPWNVEAVRALGAGVAEALEAIHMKGLVHRDLKPANVLIAADGPRVVDFGIAVAAEDTALTPTGLIVGTPGFMAPEQLKGDPITPAADVFALGALLTYAATGNGPFGTGPAQALNFRIAYEEPALTGVSVPNLEIIKHCLAKDPTHRPTVAELVEELAPAVTEDGRVPTEIALVRAAWLPEHVARALPATTSTLTTLSNGSSSQSPAAQQAPLSSPAPATPPRAVGAAPDAPRPRPGWRVTVSLWTAATALTLSSITPFHAEEFVWDDVDQGWLLLLAGFLSLVATACLVPSLRGASPSSGHRRSLLYAASTVFTTEVFVGFVIGRAYDETGQALGPGGLLYAVGCASSIYCAVAQRRLQAPHVNLRRLMPLLVAASAVLLTIFLPFAGGRLPDNFAPVGLQEKEFISVAGLAGLIVCVALLYMIQRAPYASVPYWAGGLYLLVTIALIAVLAFWRFELDREGPGMWTLAIGCVGLVYGAFQLPAREQTA
ncbi:serine/threonine-protein kinase [Streptomyces sp. NPDC094472]